MEYIVELLYFHFQSSEELEELTVDEQLSDIERAVYLLRYVLKKSFL
jgi:hypothetical protein